MDANALNITVCELIEQQAQANGDCLAAVDDSQAVSYKQLLRRANAIAKELKEQGVEPGSLVGVCVPRSWEMIAAILGIWKAACAYVPLDPKYPRERVHYMLEHSRAAAVIVNEAVMQELRIDVGRVIDLGNINDHVNSELPALIPKPQRHDLAYVIYTSGSTGKPKGVAVEHSSIVAMRNSMRELLSDQELSGVLAVASICFDPSVMEIFGTLSLGGTVILAQNAIDWLGKPSAQQVKTCIMVPSAMQALLKVGQLPVSLQTIVFGGEVLKATLVNSLYTLNRHLRLVNVYGPTECTVFATAEDVSIGDENITIGRAVASVRAFILNEAMQVLPPGVAGELYLAGDQLARGYLYDEALTQQRFVQVRLGSSVNQQRLYRTGDLCCLNEAGKIQFLGRADQQVKVRGYRIELEEIESMMESMPAVEAAAVILSNGANEQKHLLAYMVCKDPSVKSESVRAYLQQHLPGYMVPQLILTLQELPYQPNGKLDRQALPLPDTKRTAISLHQEISSVNKNNRVRSKLQDELTALPLHIRKEKVLSLIRSEITTILAIDDSTPISPDHALQELGIDSLSAVELSARITALIDRKLPASGFMQNLTLAAAADYVLEHLGNGKDSAQADRGQTTFTDSLASFQTQIQSCNPSFLVAKAPAWAATDKALVVQAFKQLAKDSGSDPHSKLVRTGSAHQGVVADVNTNEEQQAIIWTTNLYLGMNRDPDVITAARTAVSALGTGMGTSAAATGLTDLHIRFENTFAEVVGKPAACMFPTGYTANLGVVAGILGEQDVVVMDQLCHASIVDGARVSGASIRTFRHNDVSDLETVLQSVSSPYRTILVVIEGVYSMGEGAAPVADVVRMAKQYGALILVDEAHSFGFYGERGAGICAAQGVTEQVDFIMTTLSKALGSLGGVVAASAEHIALLKASARAYIFQASTSPADTAAALAALQRISTDDAPRKRLWDTTRYMREQFLDAGYDLGTGDGPIVTPHFADKDKLFAIVQGLYSRGIHTSAVTYPIVESGRGRLRFICSASHTRDDVDKTLAALIDAEHEVEAYKATPTKNPENCFNLSALQDWAEDFAKYLQLDLAKATMNPNLLISLGIEAEKQDVNLLVEENAITFHSSPSSHLPSCSLSLLTPEAMASLCQFDGLSLLDNILKGNILLKGQVEAFFWLMSRMLRKGNEGC